MSIQETDFGTLPDGQTVSLFVLTNKNGLSLKVSNYGGILVQFEVPDRKGRCADILAGRDSLKDYLSGHPYFGCITGRVAGRIGGASFELEGQTYPLVANDGPNCLHGGLKGYDKELWTAAIIETEGRQKLRLSLTDPDGNNGFPGTVDCSVTYALLDSNILEINYEAQTSKATPFNITNHAYFNLRGEGNGNVLGHQMQIFSSSIAAVDANGTLTGECRAVESNFNDFRKPVIFGDRPLIAGNADTYYFLQDGRTNIPKPAATVYEPESGRLLEVFTTEPGIQFYAGLYLDDSGKRGGHYGPLSGFCLETQDYADSVHFPRLGHALLRPGKPFRSTTLFKFSTCEQWPSL